MAERPADARRLEVFADGQHHVLSPEPTDNNPLISELLRHAGLPLNTRCGGRGLCDGCLVELLDGKLIHAESRVAVAARPGDPPQTVQACRHRLNQSFASVRIPLRSFLKHQPQIVSDYKINISAAHDPLVQEIHVREPTDIAAQLAGRFPGQQVICPPAMQHKATGEPQVFVTVETRPGHRLVTEVADTSVPAILGAAIDIGTTTVALILTDLRSGSVLAKTSSFNEQMHLGDDVLTRINFCAGGPDKIAQLQAAIADQTILPLLEEAMETAGADIQDLRCVCIAGNTTMLHLLAGIDPTSIGTAPFKPAFLDHRVMNGDEIFTDKRLAGISCHLLPGASGYVGADLTGGVLATGMLYDEGPSLLVDVGTNGEIVLKHGEKFLGCATAAGPAFEGARLSSGMRAADGAISHVSMDDEKFHSEMIGGPHGTVIGLCGSAYVDFLATAYANGVLSAMGRFETNCADLFASRLMRWNGNDTAFRLAYGPGHQPIVVSQHDIAALLQAKAAIAAGILTLLAQQSLVPAQIKTVYLAGGFGTHLNRRSAIACGMLPGFTYEQIQPVGNTSLAGAFLCLMDSGLLDELSQVAPTIEAVELNLDPEFESRYIDQLMLRSADA